MRDTVNIIYMGGLDEYHHDELDLYFIRGQATPVPAEHAARFLKAQRNPKTLQFRPESRDFYRETETIPPEKNQQYLAYPDRCITDMENHRRAYQRVHDLVQDDDQNPKLADAKRKGAQEEIDYAESQIAYFKAMKAERLAKLEGDESPTVKRARKAEAVSA